MYSKGKLHPLKLAGISLIIFVKAFAIVNATVDFPDLNQFQEESC